MHNSYLLSLWTYERFEGKHINTHLTNKKSDESPHRMHF